MNLKHTLIVDASYDYERGLTGIGIAIHRTERPRRNGVLIDQIAEAYCELPNGVGEMLAVYRALEISRDRGFSLVRIRSDYNQMRRALKRDHAQREGVDREDFHGAILRLAGEFESVEFGYKPRRKNRMAHDLARFAVREKDPICRRELIVMAKEC